MWYICSHTFISIYTHLNVLQCVAVCCSVLQCVAVCCSVLQYPRWYICSHTYIFIHTHLYIYIYIHIHTRTSIYIHTHAEICIGNLRPREHSVSYPLQCICSHTLVCLYIHLYILMYIHTQKSANETIVLGNIQCRNPCSTSTNTHMYVYTHTCIFIYIETHRNVFINQSSSKTISAVPHVVNLSTHTYIFINTNLYLYMHAQKYSYKISVRGNIHCRTGWRRFTGCLKMQVIFCKRATNHRALLQKMTYEDKASSLHHPVPHDIYMGYYMYSHTHVHLYKFAYIHIHIRTHKHIYDTIALENMMCRMGWLQLVGSIKL